MTTMREAERITREQFGKTHKRYVLNEESMRGDYGEKSWAVSLWETEEGEEHIAYIHGDGAVEGPY